MTAEIERLRIEIAGLVQGVGFRPFVYRLARACDLRGWVANNAGGVCMEVQGETQRVAEFLRKLRVEKPPLASIQRLSSERLAPGDESDFSIRPSEADAAPSAIVLPDLAPCDDCLAELFDPGNRRYRYPFTNCTHCGPRFSIVEALPYDRANTSMKHFPLCDQCGSEYVDPGDRRFHAEPNACPVCGPQIQLCDARGNALAQREDALQQAIAALEAGEIIALKSVGGFQLLVDAVNESAVKRLRARKQRPHKPFALLYPDLDTVKADCEMSQQEERLLCAQQRPILLLPARRCARSRVAAAVAPQNPDLGVMLPSSPLHHLLMDALQRPLVATSGNLAGEPICTDNDEAIARLGNIADLFLLHDRAILRPLDDSVMRVVDGRPVLLRRARGYAPLPLGLPDTGTRDDNLLALGADLKNCVAIARGNTVYPSQHIGDLENQTAMESFEQAVSDLAGFYRHKPSAVLCDLHPGYSSRRWAHQQDTRILGVQHHTAHFFSCMAEHAYSGNALGICWDGTGYGADGIIRGGEFLQWNGGARVGHIASLRAFPLPGGERAVREPRRSAAGLLFAALGSKALIQQPLLGSFEAADRKNLARMLERKINTPLCSSAGRLFDAVAALLGLARDTSFEGQAAMAVEFAARDSHTPASYPFNVSLRKDQWIIDWEPMVIALVEDGKRGVSVAVRAAAFHNTLAQMILAIAQKAGEENIFTSGGVFQNKRLTDSAAALLRENGFRVHCHSSVPPNDGGIALGQLYYARCMARHQFETGEGSAQCV